MLVQIAVLAWLFPGEPLGIRELAAFAPVVAGLLVLQSGRAHPGGARENAPPESGGSVARR